VVSRERAGRVVVILITIILILFLLFPFFVTISTMLKPAREIYATPPYWIPKRIALYNFVNMWKFHPFAQYFATSSIVAFSTTALTTLLCVPAAYALARFRFRGQKVFFFTFLAIQMFSPIVVLISLFKIMVFLRLLNTYFALILANTVFALSFCTWMLSGYFKTIPLDIEQAALIDGCSRLQTIEHIMIPISAPGVATVLIYSFILAWNDLIFALAFVTSINRTPVTLGIQNFVGRFYSQWDYLSCAAFLGTIPVVVLFLFIEKQLVAGIAGGAVKG